MTELGLALFEGEPKPENAINLHVANAIARAEGLNAKAKERIDRAFELLKAETEGRLVVLPHGRWKLTHFGDWECTNCKEAVNICVYGRDETEHRLYCPNCGAKMDLEEE